MDKQKQVPELRKDIDLIINKKELPCAVQGCEFKRKTKAGDVCLANRKMRRAKKCCNKKEVTVNGQEKETLSKESSSRVREKIQEPFEESRQQETRSMDR